MKKIILLIAVFFAFISVDAQITQSESDSIVQKCMEQERRQYTLYAKNNVQADFIVVTFNAEILELEYSCWAYYVSFIEDTNANHYIIVKENNGNILQVNPKNNTIPNDLEEWRIMGHLIEIPFTEYILDDSCQWITTDYSNDTVILINSNEELENHIICTGGNYSEIDFSKKTLFVASGISYSGISYSTAKVLMRLDGYYELNIELKFNNLGLITPWQVAIVIDKLDATSIVDLKVKYVF